METLINWLIRQPENVRDAIAVLLGGSAVMVVLAELVVLGFAPWPILILVLMMILATALAVYEFPSDIE